VVAILHLVAVVILHLVVVASAPSVAALAQLVVGED
jgi:hypothetical protein